MTRRLHCRHALLSREHLPGCYSNYITRYNSASRSNIDLSELNSITGLLRAVTLPGHLWWLRVRLGEFE